MNLKELDLILPKYITGEYKLDESVMGDFRLLKEATAYLGNQQFRVLQTARAVASVYDEEELKPRFTGDPAINHPLETAISGAILPIRVGYEKLPMRLPAENLTLDLIHDTTEDLKLLPIEMIRRYWGDSLADGVETVGIPKSFELTGDAFTKMEIQRDLELHARMFEAVEKNLFALSTRLRERHNNLQKIDALFEHKPKSALRTAEETLVIYSPLLWRLGAYDLANEDAEIAIGVRFPQETRKLRELLPAFNGEKQQELDGIIEAAFEGTEYRHFVYTPNWKQLGQELMSGRRIEDIEPTELPIIADIVVENTDDAWMALGRLNDSGYFDIPMGFTEFLLEMQRKKSLPQYITLYPKVHNHVRLAPVRFAFMNYEQLLNNQASIFHILTTNSIPEGQREASVAKIEAVKRDLKEAQQLVSPGDAKRSVLFENVINRKTIFLDVHFSHKGIDLPAFQFDADRGDTFLFTLAKAFRENKIDLATFIRMKNFRVGTQPLSESKLDNKITHDAKIQFEIDEFPTMMPNWLDALKKIDPKELKPLSREFRKILSGVYIGDGVSTLDEKHFFKYKEPIKRRESVYNQAVERGKRLIEKGYDRYDVDSKIDPIYVLQEKDIKRYQLDKNLDNLYLAIGIGEISTERARQIGRKISEFRKSLVEVNIDVTFDVSKISNIQNTAASVFGKNDLNLVVTSVGNRKMEFFIQPVQSLSPDELYEKLLKIGLEISNDIRRVTFSHFQKTGGIRVLEDIPAPKFKFSVPGATPRGINLQSG